MSCKYDKNHDKGTEMNGRAPSIGPGLSSAPRLSQQQFVTWLWTHKCPLSTPTLQVPYLTREGVELNYL